MRVWALRVAGLAAVVLGGLVTCLSPARAEPLFDQPVYSPEAGSYFELVKVEPGQSNRYHGARVATWAKANRMARKRVYKGARGRLAVVKSQAVNDFLRDTFRPNKPVWIGLRYWCKYNKLQWVTGEFHPLTEYANWDRFWNHGGVNHGGNREPSCNEYLNYWPVHYWGVQDGFRWNANGTAKEQCCYFVEYPTGTE